MKRRKYSTRTAWDCRNRRWRQCFMRSPGKPSQVKASPEADDKQKLKWTRSHLLWRGFLPAIDDSVCSSM